MPTSRNGTNRAAPLLTGTEACAAVCRPHHSKTLAWRSTSRSPQPIDHDWLDHDLPCKKNLGPKRCVADTLSTQSPGHLPPSVRVPAHGTNTRVVILLPTIIVSCDGGAAGDMTTTSSAADIDGKGGRGRVGAAWYLAVASERFAMYLQTAWPTESSFARSRYIPDPGSIEGLLLGPLGPQIPLTSLRYIPGPRVPKRFTRQSLTTLPGVHRGRW